MKLVLIGNELQKLGKAVNIKGVVCDLPDETTALNPGKLMIRKRGTAEIDGCRVDWLLLADKGGGLSLQASRTESKPTPVKKEKPKEPPPKTEFGK
jgi:hypothetical protein